MTIQNTTRKVRSDGNGSVTAFSFPFKIFSASELEVYKVNKTTQVATLQTLTTHYTVSINTITEGGTVTFVTAPTSNEEAFIRRVLARTQLTDIPNVGSLRETQLENQFDREVMILQELEEELSRTVKLPTTSALDSIEFPEPEADKVLAWNDTEDGLENVTNPATAATEAAASAAAAASSASAASSSATSAASSASAASSSASSASASAAAAAASAASAENTLAITQVAHGLAVNDLIKYTGTAYAKAQADSLANSHVVGIVTSVADADNFTFTKTVGARITTLSGLTAGAVYYLSPSSAGAMTATQPIAADDISKPVLIALSTTSGVFINDRSLLENAFPLNEVASAPTTAANQGKFYTKESRGKTVPFFREEANGTEKEIGFGYELLFAQTSVQGGDTKADTTTGSDQAFATTYDIPANMLVAGRVIRLTFRGNVIGVANQTATVKVKLDSTTVFTTAASGEEPLGGAGSAFVVRVDIICISTGGSGTVEAQGEELYKGQGIAGLFEGTANTAVISVDTTQPLTVGLTVNWSANNGSSMVQRQMLVEKLN